MRRRTPTTLLRLFSAIACLALAAPARAGDYPHKGFRATAFGSGATSYWLFEPAEPTPKRAPVVVFAHGWLSFNPGVYGAWIEHLCRSGRVVIFPKYQANSLTQPADFLPNATAAIRDAFDVLESSPDHIRPDRARFALIGHSAGGNLVAQLAATARGAGLPKPKALVVIFPGEVKPLREPDLASIPAETLLVVAAADGDRIVGDHRARRIFAEAASIPASRKKYVLYRTDREGPAPMIADHWAPTAFLNRLDSGEGPFRATQMAMAHVDILDRFGFWRLADLTIEAGFSGLTLDGATRHGEAFRDLGRWSDGRVVLPPVVGDDLAAIPRVFPAHGVRLVPWDPGFLRRSDDDNP